MLRSRGHARGVLVWAWGRCEGGCGWAERAFEHAQRARRPDARHSYPRNEGKGKVYNRSQSIVSEFLWREVNALDSLVMRPMGNKALIHTAMKIFEHQVYIRSIVYSLRHTLYIMTN